MSRQLHNVAALMKLGADASHHNTFGLTAASSMVFSSIVLGPLIWGPRRSKPQLRGAVSIRGEESMEIYNKRAKPKKGGDRKVMEYIFELLGPYNGGIDTYFRRLALAWCPLDEDSSEHHLSIIPFEPQSNGSPYPSKKVAVTRLPVNSTTSQKWKPYRGYIKNSPIYETCFSISTK